MKKNLMSMLLLMAAVATATTFTSCGDEESSLVPEEEGPKPQAVQGKYTLNCPLLTFSHWPDDEAEKAINDSYEQYKNNIFSTLQIENDKWMNWDDIAAQESRIKEAYSKIGNFEYTLKACKNWGRGSTISLIAIEDKFIDPMTIYFEDKKAVCKFDMPENTTCQLYIEIQSNEIGVPSLKEFNGELRTKFVDALKEIFTSEYGTQSNTWALRNFNIANFPGDRKELINRVKDICGKVEIPEVPANLKEDVVKNTTLRDLFTVKVEAFDPNATAPLTPANAEDVFELHVSAR